MFLKMALQPWNTLTDLAAEIQEALSPFYHTVEALEDR